MAHTQERAQMSGSSPGKKVMESTVEKIELFSRKLEEEQNRSKRIKRNTNVSREWKEKENICK